MKLCIIFENIPEQIDTNIKNLYGNPWLELKKQKIVPRVGEHIQFFDCRTLSKLNNVKFKHLREFIKQKDSVNYLRALSDCLESGCELLVIKVSHCYEELLFNDGSIKIKHFAYVSVDCQEFMKRCNCCL